VVPVIGKAHLDAELGQGVGEQVVGATVEGGGGDDVIPGFGDGENGVGDGGGTGSQGQGTYAPFQGGDPLFQHVIGGIHDPGVDVARHLQIEQVGPVLGVVEGKGSGLVDGDGHRFGGGVRGVTGMDGKGFDFRHR